MAPMRILARCFLLVALLAAGLGAATTTTIDLRTATRPSIPASFTTTAATDDVTITISTPAHTVMLQGTAAWRYLDKTTGKIVYVDTKQVLIFEYPATTTFSVTRESADGVVTVTVLK